MFQWSVGQIQKRERERGKIQFCFGCFKSERRSENTREEWRSWRASTKTTWGEKDIYKDKDKDIYKDNVRWKSRNKHQNDANINVMEIVRKMRSTLEKRLEKSAKSLEDQRREKQRKIARWLEPKSIWTKKDQKSSLKRLRQSESSCERRRRAQKLKNDLEDGLQLWSQQVLLCQR